MSVCQGGRFVCKSHVRTDIHNQITSFSTPQGLGPADLAYAYNLNARQTATKTIAIVVAFNYPNAESDLATYRNEFGLPPCTKASGCLQILNQDGATSPLPGQQRGDWMIEAALDLDMASAACPSCKLILFEANDNVGNGLFVAQNAAAAIPGVVSISNSWGAASDGTDATLDSEFFTHTAAINTFVASGDSGFTDSAPDYPSTSGKVISVGGTSLFRAAVARGWIETAWSGAGSSCSNVLTKPSFQSVVPAAACGMRAAADVAAVADPLMGLAVYNADAGGWIVVGGTSAASPFVAGVFARYSISGASHDARYAYGHTSEFFDIIFGSNGSCNSSLCIATPGWDGPTGVGTPNGYRLGRARQNAAADPFGYTRSDEAAAVLHRDASNHIREMYFTDFANDWRSRDLTTMATGAPPAAGKLSAYVRTDRVNDVLFRSADGHVWVLSLPFDSDTWIPNDLTLLTGISAAASDPVGFVRSDGVNQITFRGTDNHIHTLHLDPTGHWLPNDLTNNTGVAPAAGDPASYVRSDSVSAMVFRGTDNHILDLHLEQTGVWIPVDLTRLGGGPVAASDPVAFQRSDGGNDILYRGIDNVIYALNLDSTGHWVAIDMNAIVQGPRPVAAGRPAVNVRSDGVSEVDFRGVDNHIYVYHLESAEAGWLSTDLTSLSSGPLAASDPWEHVLLDNATEVVFKAVDGHIWALTLSPVSGWGAVDLTLRSHE
jgi:hypothetical protein